MRRRTDRRWAALAIVVGVGFAVPAGAALPAQSCATNIVGSRNTFEVRAGGRSISAVMSGRLPFRAGAPVVKVVWTLDGAGALRVELADPSGRQRPLAWGPKRHVSAGQEIDEWGSGFSFDRPGCWTIVLRWDKSTATVRFRVA